MGLLFLFDDILSIILFFGVLYGFGSGIVGMANIIIINTFFSKYRTVALGIMLSGTSTGAFIWPPLVEYAISIYGLKGCYLILTGIIMQGFIVAILYRASADQQSSQLKTTRTTSINSLSDEFFQISFTTAVEILDNETANKEESITEKKEISKDDSERNICLTFLKSLFDIFRVPMFHVIWITFTVFDFCFYTFLTIIVDHSIDCAISEHKAVFLLSASSFSELFGRFGGGWIVDLKLIKRKNIIPVAFFLKAMCFLALPFLKQFIVLMILTACIGLTGSIIIINCAALYADYLGSENLPLAMGCGAAFTGIMSLVTPRIIGYIRDTTGDYNLLFYTFGGLLIVSVMIWLSEPLMIKFQPKRTKFSENECNDTKL